MSTGKKDKLVTVKVLEFDIEIIKKLGGPTKIIRDTVLTYLKNKTK